jgi:hypothetical protein
MKLITFFAIIFVFTGCGNEYVTKSPIAPETMMKIETVVDSILEDKLNGLLAKEIVESVSKEVFVDGASAVLGWRFKDSVNLKKMFPEEFLDDNLTPYVAAGYGTKMEYYLIPAAEDCWDRIQTAVKGEEL